MSEFLKALSDLQSARSKKNSEEEQLRQDLERQSRLQKEIENAERAGNGHNLEGFHSEKARLDREINKRKKDYLSVKEGVFGDLDVLFERFGKPQELIQHWDDHTPVLLFPVRIETRFAQNANGRAELLVRVFPDEISVVQHEPILTEKEVASGKLFWEETWKAADEIGKLAAWRALVDGYGPYRAAFIARRTRPANLDSIDENLLEFPPAPPALSIAEHSAGKAYWRAVWVANGDAAAIQSARQNLETAVGTSRAPEVAAATQPKNWDNISGFSPKDWFEEVADYQLREEDGAATDKWRRASYSDVLPDKFVFIGYRNGQKIFEETGRPVADKIAMSPDPKGIDSKVERDADGNLNFLGDMSWMKNFDEAEQLGLAKRIAFDTPLANIRIDRLVVLGLNFVDDKTGGTTLLEKLFDNHRFAARGMSFLPQGTPTNNTDSATSDYVGDLSAEESYDIEMKAPLFQPVPNAPFYEKSDGQRTAEALGISPSVFQHIRNSDRRELFEAQAMNVALWNATLGYYMDEMLDPLATRADIQHTFGFFTKYVSARGALPAFRVGRQPYGILPTTDFSKWQWTPDEMSESRTFYPKLLTILKTFEQHWRKLVPEVPFIGKTTSTLDADFLKIVGLNPTSVAYAHRFFWGLQMSRTIFKFHTNDDVSPETLASWKTKADALIHELGFDIAPAVANKEFRKKALPLDPSRLIDTEPLSETLPVKPFFKDEAIPANNINYLRWLRTKTLEEIRNQLFKNEKNETVAAPSALLYQLLRHAVLQSFWDSAMKIYEDFKVVNWDARKEVQIANVKAPAVTATTDGRGVFSAAGQSRDFTKWEYLNASISDNVPALQASGTMAQYLEERVRIPVAQDSNLHLVNAAIEKLENLPTARLERLMAEHIDLCSYRLDGWQNGLLQKRLEYLRYEYRSPNEERRAAAPRPGIYLAAYGWLENLQPAQQTSKVSSRELPAEFAGRDTSIQHSLDKGGFIHAPSIQHAVTAALLRNGYLTHANQTDRDRFSINLSSERVRRALFYLEGIRNGQEFGALLGYEFERKLHDDQIDTYIYRFREKFPFKFNRKTEVETGQSIEVAAVRNVVDGYALLNDVKKGATYPYGVTGLPASGTDADKIKATVDLLLDSMDAVADLALSESVHQFVQGNQAKTGAALKMVQEGHFPSLPDVVQTPRGGNGITNRVLLQLDANAAAPAANASPRSIAEPALNKWLTDVLGNTLAQTKIVVHAFKKDVLDEKGEVSFIDLNLQPIDLMAMVGNGFKELEKRIFYEYRRQQPATPLDAILKVMTNEKAITPTALSLAEVLPLLLNVQNIVQKSRTADAQDYRLPNEVKPIDPNNVGNIDVNELKTRIETTLTNFKNNLLDPFIAVYDAIAAELKREDNDDAAKLTFVKGELMNPARDWENKFKLAALHDAADFYPPVPLAFVGAVIDDDFANTEKPVEELQKMFSPQFFGSPNNYFTFSFLSNVVSLKTVLQKQYKSAQDILNKLTPTTKTNDAVPLLTDAAKAVLGSSSVVLPRFSMENSTELQTAFGGRSDLWTFKKEQLQTALPDLNDAVCEQMITEEWLQGVGRVRTRMSAVERLKILAETLQSASSATSVSPVQLPYLGQKYWVALDMPETEPDAEGNPKPVAVDRNYLSLMIMNLPAGANFSTPQCALMLDDWTELIPNRTENTGVALNYNQPNSEPPQCLLLAISPTLTGNWSWENLLGSVNATLDRAKQRAVEPDIIAEKSVFSQLLPAIATVYSNERLNISLDFSKIYKRVDSQ